MREKHANHTIHKIFHICIAYIRTIEEPIETLIVKYI